jgi:hypothetical protein
MWHQVNSVRSYNSKDPGFAGEIYQSCFEQQMFLVPEMGTPFPLTANMPGDFMSASI